MRRQIRLKLGDILKGESVNSVARRIGVHPATLSRILEDDSAKWNRRVIETLCDEFSLGQAGIGEIFEFVKDQFWEPFVSAKEYVFIRGSESDKSDTRRIEVRDQAAIATITDYLRTTVAECEAREGSPPKQSLIGFLREHNSIVVGSLISNPYTELIVSALFGAKPDSSGKKERDKIPFAFVFRPEQEIRQKSTLIEPFERFKKSGIYLKQREIFVETDWWDRESFYSRQIRRGHDAGFVLVVNKPFNSSHSVKLIVFGGFSGVGTKGMAEALIYHFRDLEPRPAAPYVLGIAQVIYKKTSGHEDNREVIDFHWKYLAGGRRTEP